MLLHRRFARLALVALCCLLGACSLRSATTVAPAPTSQPTTVGSTGTGVATPTQPLPRRTLSVDQFRKAYGVDQLIAKGFTGKGQSVVDIVSFGSPTLVGDVNAFSQHFGLPQANIQILAPIGAIPPFDPSNKDMAGWQGETDLDVEIIHAIAPDAKIVVLESPVSETEGTIGLPEFLKLEQYAFDNHLGAVVSQSWGASEATLTDSAGQAEIKTWDTFLQTTTKQGITYLAGSGDFGASDFTDLGGTQLSTKPTSSFPDDDPWVTAVGGTTLETDGTQYREVSWQGSGGGFSAFYPTPAYQQSVAAQSATPFGGQRGIPDVAADADPNTGLEIYIAGQLTGAGGTSASTPLWAALIAIANQMAGHNLGFINTALYTVAASANGAQDFNDITVGNNNVNSGGVVVQGFMAGTGWDAVTGLGSPNAPNLLPDLIAAAK